MKKLFDIFLKKGRCLPLSSVHGTYAVKYRSFKTLLRHNHNALNIIADMEQMYYSGRPFSLTSARIKYEELLEAVIGIIHNLNFMSEGRYSSLYHVCDAIDDELFEKFSPKCSVAMKDIVLSFEEITSDMKPVVGAKAANLAVIRNDMGLPVPPGFAITSYAFERFMEENRLTKPIEEELSRLSPESTGDIERAGNKIRAMILRSEVPSYIADAIMKAYMSLEEKTHKEVRIAMRSSAVGEDTEATFAGQYSTVLNVTRDDIIEAYKNVVASKYSARAISYRLHHGLEDRETPMCVAGVVMVDSKASGVMYTVDPSLARSCAIQINSIWGLGEYLVSGSASPDVFLVERKERELLERHISRKESKLTSLPDGGTKLTDVPDNEKERQSINDSTIVQLSEYGLMLEEFYESPQDIEWAVDAEGRPFILQSRPLNLPEINIYTDDILREYPDNPILFSNGKTASAGIATGKVFILKHESELDKIPENSILVVRTMSPNHAKVMGKIKGIISDIGSITSHLSSVAREFGIPAIVDAQDATSLLSDSEVVTMSANTTTVYKGVVEALLKDIRPSRKLIFESPVHRKMRLILDRISPLNLTDAGHPSFSPEGCKTFHDIIRFTHEYAMKEMFGITDTTGKISASAKLTSTLPLNLRFVDLGGGLREGLTTCDTITPECIESRPMKAIWNGFTHPGIDWAGTMSIDTGKLTSLLAVSATSEFGETPGGESYAILSKDYLNLSAKFAYHFATIDTLCSEDSNQNYISLQFSGGAGNYYGRSLRIQFMSNVLDRLGFQVSIKGDLIDAFISRYDKAFMMEKLDQMGRLLASCRLLDMTISNQEEIEVYTNEFFNGNYDFILKKRDDELKGFYTHGGYWRRAIENGHVYCVQDGSKWGRGISSGIAGMMGKVIGRAYQEFLDNIESYYYFPVAILKDSEMSDGTISVKIKPVSGNIDRAGGIAFGIKNIDNYFVIRTNALEGNVILFEYVNGRRIQRVSVRKRVESGKWHLLKVEIKDNLIKGYFNDEMLIEYNTENPLKAFVGLWTKADSVIYFDEMIVETNGQKRIIEF
ncbi:MAG: PEP/pyruvate-binding domain-containing protein [Nitrospirota bacterium]